MYKKITELMLRKKSTEITTEVKIVIFLKNIFESKTLYTVKRKGEKVNGHKNCLEKRRRRKQIHCMLFI